MRPSSRLAIALLCALGASACGAEPEGPASGAGATATSAPSAPEAGFVDVPPRDVTLHGRAVRIASTARLFYNLRPADDAAETRPILVAFNGFAAEVVRAFGTGPTTVAEGGDVVPNPSSLTRFASVLYVEPRQAGYSYDVPPAGRGPVAADGGPDVFDEHVDAADVLLGVLAFLEAHPSMRGPVVWLGESYGGVRVTWILAYLRGRFDLAPYRDPTLEQAIHAHGRAASLRAGAILLEPWLAGGAEGPAIDAACRDPALVAAVSSSVGAACDDDACACALAHDRSLYDFAFTDAHQRQREREASAAHVDPSRAAALLGVALETIDGLAAPARSRGWKCSAPDDSVPDEAGLAARLGALPAGQAYDVPWSPLLPGKEAAPTQADWLGTNDEGAAFLDHVREVPTFVTDGRLDLVVPTRALGPALATIAGPGRVDASTPGAIRVATPDGPRTIEVHAYPQSGHMVTMTEPASFAEDVGAWLAELDPGR
jgi:hypothetical protein